MTEKLAAAFVGAYSDLPWESQIGLFLITMLIFLAIVLCLWFGGIHFLTVFFRGYPPEPRNVYCANCGDNVPPDKDEE